MYDMEIKLEQEIKEKPKHREIAQKMRDVLDRISIPIIWTAKT